VTCIGFRGGPENPWYDDTREDVMGRRGMSSTEPVQTAVVTLDELRRQHQGHEKRLEELNNKAWLTPDEEIEAKHLKKLKLRLKDEMERLRRSGAA
jgi:hypothetical protein